MAKRKHHSMRSSMARHDRRMAHHDYRAMEHEERMANRDYMHMAEDRRGHSMGEHHSGYGMGSEESSGQGFIPRGGRYGETFKERMDLNDRRRIMQTNNGNMGPVREDFSRPCGLPYGAIQRDLGNGDYYSMNGYRVGDLYEQVDKTMREDAAALKSITKPSNW